MHALPLIALLVIPGIAAEGLAEPLPCLRYVSVTVVQLPFAVQTPGGNTTSTLYLDDRPEGRVPLFPVENGVLRGDGTWVYFETNGVVGLQRGGQSDLIPPVGELGREDCIGPDPAPDELFFGIG